ncbi:MAG: hypothetical protein ACI8XM_002749, partial [Haloarculaceae archaeon]
MPAGTNNCSVVIFSLGVSWFRPDERGSVGTGGSTRTVTEPVWRWHRRSDAAPSTTAAMDDVPSDVESVLTQLLAEAQVAVG